MFKPKAKVERRCAWCGQEVTGTGHETEGKLFCNPWHARDYQKGRLPFFKRLLKALSSGDESAGGTCC